MNYYELLEISVDATAQDIKGAYRKAAKKYHPDLNKQSNHKKMAEVNKAYETLCDPTKRQMYDLQNGIGSNYRRYQEQGTKQNNYGSKTGWYNDSTHFYENGGFDKMWEDMVRGMGRDWYQTPPEHPNARAYGFHYEDKRPRRKILRVAKIKEILREELKNKKDYSSFNETDCDFCDKDIHEGETFVFMYDKQKMCKLCVKDILKHL